MIKSRSININEEQNAKAVHLQVLLSLVIVNTCCSEIYCVCVNNSSGVTSYAYRALGHVLLSSTLQDITYSQSAFLRYIVHSL